MLEAARNGTVNQTRSQSTVEMGIWILSLHWGSQTHVAPRFTVAAGTPGPLPCISVALGVKHTLALEQEGHKRPGPLVRARGLSTNGFCPRGWLSRSCGGSEFPWGLRFPKCQAWYQKSSCNYIGGGADMFWLLWGSGQQGDFCTGQSGAAVGCPGGVSRDRLDITPSIHHWWGERHLQCLNGLWWGLSPRWGDVHSSTTCIRLPFGSQGIFMGEQ